MSDPLAKQKLTPQEAGRLGALKRKQMRERARRLGTTRSLATRSGLITSIATGHHGKLKKSKRKLLLQGLDCLDQRGEVAKLYRTLRAELLDMLGPPADITPTQRHLVEIVTRGLVYLGHVDATLLTKVSLTNETKKKALPLLVERMGMSKIVSGQLAMLGLEKKTRVRSLQEDLAASPELLSKEGEVIP